MDKIYLKDNYIVTELGGVIAVFPKNYSSYSESSTGFYINSTFPVNNQRTVFVDFTRVTSVYNEAGTVAYSIATLRSFLLLNTGFKSPSGGSGGSTITVGTTPVTSGTDGRVFFQSGGVVQQDSSFFWDNTNKRLGVGTDTPLFELDVRGAIRATSTLTVSGTALFGGTFGNKGTDIGINFETPTTQLQTARIDSDALRLFFGGVGKIGEAVRFQKNGYVGIGTISPQARLDVRAQGALSTDLILRTRNSADTRNFLVVNGAGDVFNNGAGGVTSNTFYGENVGRSATGGSNSFFGNQSGRNNTTGASNVFIGFQTGYNNTTGANNSFLGHNSGFNNLTGNFNSFFGRDSGFSNTTGGSNTAIGVNSLLNNTTGVSNIANGANAGRYISGGTNLTIANQSIFIGVDTRANADNETNQIVIGHQAIGTGSNSVTLGNTSITRTNLRGQVVISGFASAPTGVEGAIYYDSTTKKHYGFDGTNWNALY